ncbi:MAG: hypothetical protein MUP70_16475, partial [Candidatus Aminicenantes bacterium]|nr:hypothetical protein [Candidatus Aminicenantes bacterium]
TTLVKLSFFKRLVPIAEILEKWKGLNPGDGPAGPVPLLKKNEVNEPRLSGYEKQVVREPMPVKDSKKTAAPGGEPPPPRREREVDKALKEPLVQEFMDTFKAQILSAETISKDKK